MGSGGGKLNLEPNSGTCQNGISLMNQWRSLRRSRAKGRSRQVRILFGPLAPLCPQGRCASSSPGAGSGRTAGPSHLPAFKRGRQQGVAIVSARMESELCISIYHRHVHKCRFTNVNGCILSAASYHSLHGFEGNQDHVVPQMPLGAFWMFQKGPIPVLDGLQGLWHMRGNCDPRLRPCRALADCCAEGRRYRVEGLNLVKHQRLPIKALLSLISLSPGQGTQLHRLNKSGRANSIEASHSPVFSIMHIYHCLQCAKSPLCLLPGTP